jgi:rhodanese-related sulfurtransferase
MMSLSQTYAINIASSSAKPRHARAEAAYCGIYALYSAARIEGKPVDFEALLKPEYISSPSGSTLKDLQEAAASIGLSTLPFENGNVALLRRLDHPVILHVRPQIGADVSHYVLYAGQQGDQLRVWDTNSDVYVMSVEELLARWDGIGLIVSQRPLSPTGVFLKTWMYMVSGIGATVFGLFCLKRIAISATSRLTFVHHMSLWHSAICQMGILLIAIVLVAYSYHSAAEDGLFRSRTAIASLERDYAAEFLNRISVKEARAMIRDRNAIVVDARRPIDFQMGHIDGAMNIPTDSNEEFLSKMKTIPLEQTLIVYCQSNGCPYAKIVGSRLVKAGYKNVSVLVGGWIEWKSTERVPQ